MSSEPHQNTSGIGPKTRLRIDPIADAREAATLPRGEGVFCLEPKNGFGFPVALPLENGHTNSKKDGPSWLHRWRLPKNASPRPTHQWPLQLRHCSALDETSEITALRDVGGWCGGGVGVLNMATTAKCPTWLLQNVHNCIGVQARHLPRPASTAGRRVIWTDTQGCVVKLLCVRVICGSC